jgi:hypothetical protein
MQPRQIAFAIEQPDDEPLSIREGAGLFGEPRRARGVVPERRAERLLVAGVGTIDVREMMRPDPDLAHRAEVGQRMFGRFRWSRGPKAGRIKHQIVEAEFAGFARQ